MSQTTAMWGFGGVIHCVLLSYVFKPIDSAKIGSGPKARTSWDAKKKQEKKKNSPHLEIKVSQLIFN